MKKKFIIALMPGHSAKSEGAEVCAGAYKGKGENGLAKVYIPAIADRLRALGHTVHITERSNAGGTTPTYSAKAANATGANVAFEFHFNSYNAGSHGACVLHWENNKAAAKIAKALALTCAEILDTDLHGNGLIPVRYRDTAARGYNAFLHSKMPFFMLEPCFAGSNPKEADKFGQAIKDGTWAQGIADAINNALQAYLA